MRRFRLWPAWSRRTSVILLTLIGVALISLIGVHAQSTTIFSDDFNDNVRDTAKWNPGVLSQPSTAFDTRVAVKEQNQELEITPRAGVSGQHYNGYVSVNAFNLTGRRASVEARQVPGGAALAEMAVGIDSSNWYRIATQSGQIFFQDMVGGTKLSTNITYNATQHHYWRIRHDGGTDRILFETSSDNVNWTTQRAIARQLNISALRVELDAGTSGAVSAPGMAKFDNFVLDSTPAPSPTPAPIPNPSPTPAPAPTVLLSDDFNAASLDATKWYVGAVSKPFDPAVSVRQQNGQLQISPLSGVAGDHFAGYVSLNKWNLTGAVATVQLVQPASSAGGNETNFYLSVDSINWYRFKVEAGTIYFYQDVGGAKTYLILPYDATQHKWLRLRHDPATDSVVWETSPDNASWTVQRTEARQFPITSLNVELIAGTYQAVGAPGTAIFDNFVLQSLTATPTPTPAPLPAPTPTPFPAPTPAPPPAPSATAGFADDFNNNARDATKWSVGVFSKDSSQFDPLVPVLEQNGQLQIKPLANTLGLHYNGYVSARGWDMTGSQASVEVVQTTGGPGMSFVVGIDSNDWYRVSFYGGTLYFQDQAGGASGAATVPYSAAQHRFWRIRHDAATDQIVFETSPDRAAWAVQRVVARQLPPTAMRAELSAGTYESWGAPGTAAFDNFQLQTRTPYWAKRNEVVNDAGAHTFSHPQPFQLDDGELVCGFSTNEDSPAFGYKLVRSTDGGQTWGSKVTVASNGVDTYEGSFAQTSAANLVVVYGVGDAVAARRSADRGQTWGAEIIIAPPGGGDDPHPSLTKLGDGSLLAAYRYQNKIIAKRSTDGGATWGAAVTVASSATLAYHSPSVVRTASGALVLAFISGPVGGSSVLLTRSADSGSTWSAPALVSAAAQGSFNDPNLTALNNGDLVLWFVDGTPDTGARSDSFRLSHDGGQTWVCEGPVYNDGDPHRLNGIQLIDNSMLVVCASKDGSDSNYHITSLAAPANWPISQCP
jgi:hypothetical protein